MYRRDKHGFELVEVMVVVAILGILSAVMVPALKRAEKETSNRKNNIHSISYEKTKQTVEDSREVSLGGSRVVFIRTSQRRVFADTINQYLMLGYTLHGSPFCDGDSFYCQLLEKK